MRQNATRWRSCFEDLAGWWGRWLDGCRGRSDRRGGDGRSGGSGRRWRPLGRGVVGHDTLVVHPPVERPCPGRIVRSLARVRDDGSRPAVVRGHAGGEPAGAGRGDLVAGAPIGLSDEDLAPPAGVISTVDDRVRIVTWGRRARVADVPNTILVAVERGVCRTSVELVVLIVNSGDVLAGIF